MDRTLTSNWQEKKTRNGSVEIHSVQALGSSDRPALVIIPGMINSADEVKGHIERFISRRTIILSLRGRGESDSPASGYTFEDQCSDVVAVVRDYGLADYILAGHSVGAAVALRSASQLRPRGVVMLDYPPYYPNFGAQWAERILKMEVDSISAAAVHALASESVDTDLSDEFRNFPAPMLLLRGSRDDSLISEAALTRMRELRSELVEGVIEAAGHELINDSPSATLEAIEQFASRIGCDESR